jgi:hypothetical protein
MKPLSFALLFQFGVELWLATRDPDRPVATFRGQPLLRFVPAACLVMWVVATYVLSTTVAEGFVPQVGPWLPSPEIGDALADVGAPLAVGDAVARYLIAFPAALFVAVALRRTTRQLAPMAGRGVPSPRSGNSRSSSSPSLEAGADGRRSPASVLNEGRAETLGIDPGVRVCRAGGRDRDHRHPRLFEQETDRALADARRRSSSSRERAHRPRPPTASSVVYAAGLHLSGLRRGRRRWGPARDIAP